MGLIFFKGEIKTPLGHPQLLECGPGSCLLLSIAGAATYTTNSETVSLARRGMTKRLSQIGYRMVNL